MSIVANEKNNQGGGLKLKQLHALCAPLVSGKE